MTRSQYEKGMVGQQAAEAYLLNKGYRILARNFRVPTGEIDLIAEDVDYIVFIEVKSRNGSKYGLPREAVTPRKQARIIETALHYIAQHELTGQDFRFDVVEVLFENHEGRITHIENAFT